MSDSPALAPLGEVVKPTRPRVKPADYADLPYIGMEHIEAHTMELLGTVPARTMKSSAVHFKPGDVLYGRLRPYLNKVYRPSFEGLCSAEFIVLPENDRIDGAYLQYFLNSSAFVRYASHLNTGDRPRVDFEQLAPYEMPLPPLGGQRCIVAEIEKQLSRLDGAAANLKRAAARLTRFRESVLDGAFDLLPTTTIASLVDMGPQNGLYLPKSKYGEGIPILRIDDYQFNWLRPVPQLKRVRATEEQVRTWSMKAGDLVINRVNSPSHLGKTTIVPPSMEGALFESNMMRVRLVAAALPRFIELYLASRLGRQRLTANAKWAVNQASINQQDVGATPVPLPSLAEQHRVVAEVDRRLSLVQQVEVAARLNISRASRARQSVLQCAYSSAPAGARVWSGA